MTPQVTVQLYSVRDAASQDYEGTIRALAAMGFRNVEPAGYPGTTPEQAAKLFAELGIQCALLSHELADWRPGKRGHRNRSADGAQVSHHGLPTEFSGRLSINRWH